MLAYFERTQRGVYCFNDVLKFEGSCHQSDDYLKNWCNDFDQIMITDPNN